MPLAGFVTAWLLRIVIGRFGGRRFTNSSRTYILIFLVRERKEVEGLTDRQHSGGFHRCGWGLYCHALQCIRRYFAEHRGRHQSAKMATRHIIEDYQYH